MWEAMFGAAALAVASRGDAVEVRPWTGAWMVIGWTLGGDEDKLAAGGLTPPGLPTASCQMQIHFLIF